MHMRADYVMRNFFYARTSGADNTQHYLDAAADAELIKDLFFIDGTASIGQQAISPFGPQVVDSGNLTSNRSEVQTYSLSPYLRHHFGQNATAELRVSRDSVHSNADDLLDSKSDRLHIGLKSGKDFSTMQWNVVYDDQRIDYKASDDVELKSLTGSLRYLVSSRLALTGTAGYEKNDYVAIGGKPEGSFWSLGAEWMPSERTFMAISAGRRYFGNTLSLALQHRTRIAVWRASYQEEITTSRSLFVMPSTPDTAAYLNELFINSIPDKVEREGQVNRFIHDANLPTTLFAPVNTFSNSVFLQKSAALSATSKGAKNTLIVSVFHTEREPQSVTGAIAPTITGTALGEEVRQNGVSALWNWSISPRTNVFTNAAFNRASLETTDRRDDNITFRVGMTHQIQQKVSGGVEVRHLEKRSSQSNEEFRENALTAFLLVRF